MAYIINKFNGDQLTIVEDGTINTETDVTLIGKDYPGYGEKQNENFVFLLENFSSTSAPNKKVVGQLWFNSYDRIMQMWDGSTWKRIANTFVEPDAAAVSNTVSIGDFWWDTTNSQLNVWNGSDFTLIGPYGTGTEMRIRSVIDTGNVSHMVIEGVVNNDTVFLISTDDAFTLDSTVNQITGYTTVYKGLTINNTNPQGISTSYKYHGTATNAEKLGGLSSSDYIQSTNPVFDASAQFSDAGFSVGLLQHVLTCDIQDGDPVFKNVYSDTIEFATVNKTNTNTVYHPLTIIKDTIHVGNISPLSTTSKIGTSTDVFSDIYGTNLHGNASTASAMTDGTGTYNPSFGISANFDPGTVAVRTNAEFDFTTVTGNVITVPTGSISANYFAGTAVMSMNADLAEKYLSDEAYEVGTVVVIGGEKEVTASRYGDRAIGVVSENPALMMNTALIDGTFIALKGRVPVKVHGTINKGDRLVAGDNGCAVKAQGHEFHNVFAIALESNSTDVIEALIL